MTQKQFDKKIHDLIIKKGELVAKFYKEKSNDKKKTTLLELLGYNQNFITILTNWKGLNFIENDTANKLIAQAIETNRETYNQLLLLR